MLRLLFVFVLLQAFAVSSLAGFSTESVSLKTQKARPLKETRLFAELDKDSSATDEIAALPEARPSRSAVKAIQAASFLLIDVFSAFIVGTATLSICGMLLNLNGYGYQIRNGSVRVDTIEHMRMENQLNKEYLRISKEMKPPSSLPQ